MLEGLWGEARALGLELPCKECRRRLDSAGFRRLECARRRLALIPTERTAVDLVPPRSDSVELVQPTLDHPGRWTTFVCSSALGVTCRSGSVGRAIEETATAELRVPALVVALHFRRRDDATPGLQRDVTTLPDESGRAAKLCRIRRRSMRSLSRIRAPRSRPASRRACLRPNPGVAAWSLRRPAVRPADGPATGLCDSDP